jgi:hypothetical protein
MAGLSGLHGQPLSEILDQNIQRRVTTSRNGHVTPFLSMVDRKARPRIQALEERAARRDREVAELSSRVSRLEATVEAIRASGPRPSPAVPPSPPTAAPSVPSVTAPKAPNAPSPAAARNPPPSQAPPLAASAVALPSAPAGFASLIVADFPALFAEFRGKRFTLLWRGSRDGFGARDFHGRCDGHAPTLTLIQDTEGNIFGGFTPVQWESGTHDKRASQRLWKSNCCKADPSLKSFLFTLKNPHNFPAFVIPCGLRALLTFGFPITATQTPTVAVTLATLTRTTPACTGKLFSRVGAISQ